MGLDTEVNWTELFQTAVDCNGSEVKVRSYSGRYMYGRSCLGITGGQSECMELIATAINIICDDESSSEGQSREDFVNQVLQFEQDSFGLDVVMYWPSISACSPPMEAQGE